MGTIADKLAYLSNAVDDIQAAIIEKGVEVPGTVALGSYGSKIREIQVGGGSVDVNDVISAWGAKSYSAVTVTPVTHTYTSL